MDTIKLKNGSEEAKPLVAVCIMSLKRILGEFPIAFHELVLLARDKDYEIQGGRETIAPALRSGLVFDGANGFQIHDSDRNIIVSCVEGDGPDMRLVSPVAEPMPAE